MMCTFLECFISCWNDIDKVNLFSSYIQNNAINLIICSMIPIRSFSARKLDYFQLQISLSDYNKSFIRRYLACNMKFSFYAFLGNEDIM